LLTKLHFYYAAQNNDNVIGKLHTRCLINVVVFPAYIFLHNLVAGLESDSQCSAVIAPALVRGFVLMQ